MEKEMFRKQPYVRPAIEVIHILLDREFMQTSFHSQHNPGQHGTGPSNGKQVWFDEDEDEDEEE